jgi:hypothetical protein
LIPAGHFCRPKPFLNSVPLRVMDLENRNNTYLIQIAKSFAKAFEDRFLKAGIRIA